MEIEIDNMSEVQGLHGKCLSAGVISGGHSLTFSKYLHETEWYCDAHFGPNLYPFFAHGTGGRSCMKQIAQGELKAQLDEREKQYRATASAYGY